MSEETKKIELTEQELDQVAGGHRKGIGAGGNVRAGQLTLGVSPIAGKPRDGKPSAG